MASAFINASFANLKGAEGPCELVGYLCRTRFTRKRTRRAVDFTGIAEDLVYSRVHLPEGAPEALFDPETLANAAEAAETTRMRLLQLCEADSPIPELIGVLLQPGGQAQRRDRLGELDLPNALADQAPRVGPLAAVQVFHRPENNESQILALAIGI